MYILDTKELGLKSISPDANDKAPIILFGSLKKSAILKSTFM